MVKHQDPAAKTVGSDVECRSKERERILTHRPWAHFLSRRRRFIVFAIVEHHFEEPVASQSEVFAGRAWCAIAVADVLQVALRECTGDQPVSLLRRRAVYAGAVLGFVCIEDGIALIVAALTNEPCEDAGWIGRVNDSGIVAIAVERCDIFL